MTDEYEVVTLRAELREMKERWYASNRAIRELERNYEVANAAHEAAEQRIAQLRAQRTSVFDAARTLVERWRCASESARCAADLEGLIREHHRGQP